MWHITESEDWLRANLDLYPTETAGLEAIRGEGRRREFLAARHLLHRMSGRSRRGELIKDDAGKPHLMDSTFHVSISHTVDYSAAVAHPTPCGIDVQRIVPRIRRLAHKFVGDGERAQLTAADELTQLHLIWSAKEAMYKAFGRRQLDFRRHLFVQLNETTGPAGEGSAYLKREDVEMYFRLWFRVHDGFVLAAAVEERPAIT